MDAPFDFNGQCTDYLADIGVAPARLKTGGPRKEPPSAARLDPNPRRHDVVAWRRDGARLDATRHATKEAAQEYGRGLCWVVYCQYAIMDGRDMIEKHVVLIPAGMALDENDMPCKA